jgi:hypothetical protein
MVILQCKYRLCRDNPHAMKLLGSYESVIRMGIWNKATKLTLRSQARVCLVLGSAGWCSSCRYVEECRDA